MKDEYVSLDGGLKKINKLLEMVKKALEEVVDNDRRKIEEVKQTYEDLKIKKEADEKAIREYHAKLQTNKKD